MSTSLESFVTVLKRSGLVEEPVLAKSLDLRRDLGTPLTGESFAEFLIEKEVITSWQAAKLLQGKHKGFFLGKYKLLRLLGKGGMSSVYLAEHVLMRRRCAIKVLPWKLVKDSSYLERFHREAQAVAALDHPNIVRAYDIDHEKDGNLEIHFLVMEYVEGRNLYDLVQAMGPLSPVTTADYIRQGALGLAHAHLAGMVHRDVKPGNFIVDQHGTVKLMDLGLARVSATEGDHSLTIAHDERVLGTADYLAPEQAVDSHLVDTRADLYSLGCTMYFLLTGRPPFNEGTLTQRLLAHQTKEPTPIEKLRPEVPKTLVSFLRKLMEKDREKRYQSAEEVSTDFEQWLSSQDGDGTTSTRGTDQTSNSPAGIGTEAETDNPFSLGGASESSTKKIPTAGGELGNFLSSLSDVEPASGKKQPSSLLKQGAHAESSREQAQRGSGRIQTGSGRAEASVLEPNITPAGPTSSASKASATRSGSGKGIQPGDSGKSQKAERSSSKLSAPLPAEWLAVLQKYRIPVAAGGAVLLLVIGYLIFAPGEKTPPSKFDGGKGDPVAVPTAGGSGTTQSDRPAVSGTTITVGPKGNFGTIAEALDYIKQNAFSSSSNSVREVQIVGNQTFKESISIDNSGLGAFPRGVHLRGSPDHPPHLQAAENGPVVSLNSVDEFSLSDVIIDCQGLSQAVRLQGFMTGATLTNVRFENLEQVGLSGVGLGGLENRPINIKGCSFVGKSTSAEAIRLEPGNGQDTREINISSCRFLGPMAAGVEIQGSAENVSFRQNIFVSADAGVLLTGSSNPIRKHLIFANNTFAGCQRGIAFETGPFAGSSKFLFQQNLFVDSSGPSVPVANAEVGPDKLTQGARPPQFNWTDRAEVSDDSELNIFANDGHLGTKVDFVSEDPADPNFFKPTTQELKVPNSSESLKFIGAVSP